MDINIENISNYTDQELFLVMKKCNLNVGPVTGTTRKLYEKKLRTYLENLGKNNESNSVNKENKNVNDKSKLNEQTNKKKADKEHDKGSTKIGDNNENRSIIKKKENKTIKQVAAENKVNDSPSLVTPIKPDKPIETPTTPHKKHEMVHIIQPQQATSMSIHGHKINFNKPDEVLDEDVFESQVQPQPKTTTSKITIEKIESFVHKSDESRGSSKSSITETPVIHAHTHTHTHSTSNKVDSSILSNSSLCLKPNDTILKASPNVMNKFATRLSNYGLLHDNSEHQQQNHSAESTLIKAAIAKPQTPSTDKRISSNIQVSSSKISSELQFPIEKLTAMSTITKELEQIENSTLKELKAAKRAKEILDKEFVKEWSSQLEYTKQMLSENIINNSPQFKQPSFLGKPTVVRNEPSPKRQENIIENRVFRDPIPIHVERHNSLHRNLLSPSRQIATAANNLNDRNSVNTPLRQLHYENQKPSSHLEFKLLTPKPTNVKREPASSSITASSTINSTTKQKEQSSNDQWINYKYLAAAGIATIIVYFLLLPFDFISFSFSNDDL